MNTNSDSDKTKVLSPAEGVMTRGLSQTGQFVPSVSPLVQGTEIMEAGQPVSSATERSNECKGDAMPLIAAGEVVFVLKGVRYRALKSISESSGEAQIVLVERNGKQYCLKVYYPNYHFHDDILSIVWNMRMDMVMRIYDYGRTVVHGVERDYELMEYLEGGTLEQYRLEEDMRQFRLIALQATAAVAACHSMGIIHKDIKPSNFFFRDNEQTQLVLGDFGISVMMKEGEGQIRTCQSRTPSFAAPEMYDDVIDGEVEINSKSDYYSLGITFLNLWLGKNPFAKNERLMMRMKQEGRLPHIDDLPPRVAMIIKGLTCLNPMRRWGYEEVERWFRGEDVPVDTSSIFLRYTNFMVDPERNLVAHDVKELVSLLYENQELAVRYLYSNRLSAWLDECGNNKMAVLLNDIVEHRYPTDQQAGLMAALYALEPNFPYYDLKGQPCRTVHELAVTLMRNASEYQYRLQEADDTLFVYLDSHFTFHMERLRSYFQPADETSVLKLVYEIDRELPFLPKVPSSTIQEVVAAYASAERTEDEWKAITDGRLLAWLYGRAEVSVCEGVRFITSQHLADEHTKACQVLYSIDRQCGFDLADATSVASVARLMVERLLQSQDLDDEAFREAMKDYVVLGGRLELYAKLHQWNEVLASMQSILDLQAPHNVDRYAIYDLRTAAFKLCKALGGQPAYEVKGEESCQVITDPSELDRLPVKDVRAAIRNGHLLEWMSIFYHEDPTLHFENDHEYNQRVRDFLLAVGSYDGGEIHFKRYTIAQEELERKVNESRQAWDKSMRYKSIIRTCFIGVNVLWLLLLVLLGLDETSRMQQHVYAYTMLSVGIPMGIIFMVRNYFRGNGISLGLLFASCGLLASLIPAAVLSWCMSHVPGSARWAALLMSAGYAAFGLRYAFRKSTVANITDDMENCFTVNEESALNEMLYYTFRSRTFKFRGSTFGLMDDAVGEARSSSTEKVIDCLMWSLLPVVLIVAMFWFHSSLLDHSGPDISQWKADLLEFWAQVKALS